eukprot:TRINITY_DN5805_c0_g1_i4.p1 TRINITY_DN5805_c0_g1~~TRINITY_DN5805_c0_g1_i4.p1  ORF type:complete len:337 (+),score=93.33 TRINITY_DN5805_c0_g1_i4:68-1012(+)
MNSSADDEGTPGGALWWQLLLALAVPLFLLTFRGPGMWTKPTFRAHRIGGFVFLVQYAAAWALFLVDYRAYASSVLPFTVAGTLVAQVLTAIRTFTFLPKKTDDPGIYSDQGTLPYSWICEALFFALMILFGQFYYDARLYNALVRPWFPKTHFSDVFKYRSKNTSPTNVWFYDVGTYAIKVFYVAHKHMIGFFFNYLRFLNLLSPLDMYWLHWMMLVNVGTQAIGTFTHTLRFKKMLPPRVSYGIYVAYAYASYYALLHLARQYQVHADIAAVTVAGMALNFARFRGASKVQGLYQFAVLGWMLSRRNDIAIF